MTWVRSDDREPHHPKLLNIPVAAYGFFQAAKCWASDHLTDGFVPVAALGPAIYPSITRGQARKYAELLATANDPSRPDSKALFEVVEGGWKIHDYLDYNPSADHIRAERAASAARVKAWKERHRKCDGNAKVTPLLSQGNAPGNAEVTVPPYPNPIPYPIPKKKQEQARVVLTDDQFMATLPSLYPHLSIGEEESKMDGWLLVHPGRRKTRRFIIGWLNRQERPMAVNGTARRAVNDPWKGKTVAREVRLK